MPNIRSSTRLALTAGLICVAVLWLAVGLKLVPDASKAQLEGRQQLAAVLAVHAADALQHGGEAQLAETWGVLVKDFPQVILCDLRDAAGALRFSVGEPAESAASRAGVPEEEPITCEVPGAGGSLGTVVLRFQPLRSRGWSGFLTFPLPMIFFCSALVILLNWSLLASALRQLGPSRVINDRIRVAFDALADSLILVDNEYRVAMANQAFMRLVGESEETLKGRKIDSFGWAGDGGAAWHAGSAPWRLCLASRRPQRGGMVTLRSGPETSVRCTVAVTPILEADQSCRGALISLHDVTELEAKKDQMVRMLRELSASRDEMQQKNRVLQILASTDPLTGCLNRRSLFERFVTLWERVPRQNLSAIMVDIDHFKAVNDNYGHSSGDAVLQDAGRLLVEMAGEGSLVGRYGGEEFAIILPDSDLAGAVDLAERIQHEIRVRKLAKLTVTFSVGVASREQGAMDCQHLLDQADQSLYLAKRDGRDRVVAWDASRAAELVASEGEPAAAKRGTSGSTKSAIIQYPAITAMLSALAFRDRQTAAHCCRVAQLCLLVGRKLLNKRELYELEVAALLHDIGKIGVPDAILNKAGRLDEEEWRIMSRHDEIGVEIARAAFASERITEFIRCHHRQFCNTAAGNRVDLETMVPLGSRIITVCDAFDSMTHDSAYRQAISPAAAFDELYRCSGAQFDPLVVRTLERVLEDDEELPSLTVHGSAAFELGRFVEELGEAIAAENVPRLREVAQRVEQAAAEFDVVDVLQAAVRLEQAIGESEANLNQLADLADEVMGLCRLTRSAIVDRAALVQAGRSAAVRGGTVRFPLPPGAADGAIDSVGTTDSTARK